MPVKSPPFTHLGRYRVLRELGRGAMGVVYLAEDDTLQRQVAIKTLLLPEEENSAERRNLEARFIQEAKAAGGLNHPGIITIHDLGREGDWLYIAMEVLEGTELRDRMQAGPMPLDEAVDIAAQVASALAAAPARGVVHRDIKPGNIMLVGERHAKIMDFGIARMKSSDVRTQSGTMMGSPKYMSPEQVGGHPVDHRSDIFSLGSLLYEMVTGQPAFQGENLGQILHGIMHRSPPPPSQLRPGLPASIELVITRATQKNPRSRYQDAAEMARDLAQCRASLSRLPLPAVPRTDIPLDTFARTAPVAADPDATIPAADAKGWAPAPGFDSRAGLRTLAEGRAAPLQQGLSWSTTAWTCAYLLAAGVALLLAFA